MGLYLDVVMSGWDYVRMRLCRNYVMSGCGYARNGLCLGIYQDEVMSGCGLSGWDYVRVGSRPLPLVTHIIAPRELVLSRNLQHTQLKQ